MRKLLLSVLISFCCLLAKAEEKSLIITFSDNTTQTFVLSSSPQISMANDKMTVTTNSTTAEYDLYKVKTFTFSGTTDIQNIEDKTSIRTEGDKIIIPEVNARIRIFAIDGKSISITPIQINGQTIISLYTLPTGIYIININGKSVKISKQ